METTIIVLAWIGLVAVTIASACTLWAWGDQIIYYFATNGMKSRGVFGAVSLAIGFGYRGDEPEDMADSLLRRFRKLCDENPETARAFLRRLDRSDNRDWMPKTEGPADDQETLKP
jgi:hypothetical protein